MKLLFVLISLYFSLTVNSFATDRPSNELPMYGGEDKSHIEPNEYFSKGAARLGWQYFSSGDYDTAIKRFNQAWMFDHNNVEALWGFGLIMGQRATEEEPLKNLNESVRYLTMATSLEQNNERLINDLAYSHTLLGAFLKEENKNPDEDFLKAEELFKKAKAIQPNYPIIYSNWSVLEFYMGNYPKAKDLLEQSKKLGFEPDPSYVKDLEAEL